MLNLDKKSVGFAVALAVALSATACSKKGSNNLKPGAAPQSVPSNLKIKGNGQPNAVPAVPKTTSIPPVSSPAQPPQNDQPLQGPSQVSSQPTDLQGDWESPCAQANIQDDQGNSYSSTIEFLLFDGNSLVIADALYTDSQCQQFSDQFAVQALNFEVSQNDSYLHLVYQDGTDAYNNITLNKSSGQLSVYDGSDQLIQSYTLFTPPSSN